MRSAGVRVGALVAALSIVICARASAVRAQQAERGVEGPTDSETAAKMVPTLSTFLAGNITFQSNPMGAQINDIVQNGGNFSGEWFLAPDLVAVPTDIGPFTGHLTPKVKVKLTLPFPNASFPHCKILLTGASTDNGFSFTGTVRTASSSAKGPSF
jgi:hypothetical protein